jgi:hypothetical protein
MFKKSSWNIAGISGKRRGLFSRKKFAGWRLANDGLYKEKWGK